MEGVDHIAIMTSNLEQSMDFYVDKLGFQILREIDSPDMRMVFVRMGNCSLELFSLKHGKAVQGPSSPFEHVGMKHLALVVSDIEKAYDGLRKRGIDFRSPPEAATGGPRVAFFYDPDGIELELIQWG